MVKISYLEITARSDYPITGRPDLHLWEVTLQTLAKQSFKDFEYIVCDAFYEQRKDYFKEHNYGLKIKHIPVTPYVWKDYNVCTSCHQFNKGFIHADGELVFMGADNSMYHPDLFEQIWRRYKEGWLVSAGFGSDVTYATQLFEKSEFKLREFSRKNPVPTDWYNFLGFEGCLHMDHRYNEFEGTNLEMREISPQWYFGFGSLPLKAALFVNGFDENFDADSNMSDIDLGYRLYRSGWKKMAMFRDIYAIEAYCAGWHSTMKRPEVKCNYALFLYNELVGRDRANEPLSESDVADMIRRICRGKCPIKAQCRERCKHRAPFYNKNEPALCEVWDQKRTERLDLTFERELRIAGDDYKEGTYVNV